MAATTTTKRRARIRPGGIFSGLLAGLALLILLQQAGTVYPTAPITIIFLVGGLVIGLALPWLVGSMRSRSGASPAPATTTTAAPAPTAAAAPAETSPLSSDTGPWAPTHTVPPGGLDTYAGPSDANPSERLDGGLEVQVVERAGNRAHVVCSNGWTCWVEGTDLQAIGG